MSRKIDEQEQARKVRARLRMIQHIQLVSREKADFPNPSQ
jgi:hypothetical protein